MHDAELKIPESNMEAPALKSDDTSAMAGGLQMRGGDVGRSLGGSVARKPADAAADGFGGSGHDIPYRSEMEQSFGMDFGGVSAHTDKRAQSASRELGAHAYAVGNNVAFASPNPDKSLVAHELTHVAQARDGGAPQAKSAGGDTEIDKSGEHEAEKVESAVKSGKPARSALEGGVAKGGGPRLKAGRGIARSESESAPFTFGMTFSPEGMEKSYEWWLWNHRFEAPIPAVPGLNALVWPQVKLVGAGGVNWHSQELAAHLGVLGNVQFGFSYGNAALAEIYGVVEAKAEGGFEYKVHNQHAAHGGEGHAEGGHAEGGHAEGGHAEAKRWELSGGITMSANFKVGIALAGGWVDWGFEFGKVEIGKLTGLNWKDGHFDRSAVGWEWGAKPKEFFGAVHHAVERAQQLQRMGAEAYHAGLDTARRTGRAVYTAGRDAVNWISSW